MAQLNLVERQRKRHLITVLDNIHPTTIQIGGCVLNAIQIHMKTPRKPLRKVSPKRAREMRQYAKVKREFLSGAGAVICFRCSKYVHFEHRDIHHFYGRIGALLCWVPGFRMACRDCHRWIETHRVYASALGLRASEDLFNRPTKVIPR